MKKIFHLLTLFVTIFMLLIDQHGSLANETVEGIKNSQSWVNVNIDRAKDVDFSQKLTGIVKTLYSDTLTKKAKIIVKLGDVKYIYNVLDRQNYERLPLQLGNGNYSIEIYENTSGSKYQKVYSESGTVDIEDQTTVFLSSMQQVLWFDEDMAIQMANTLVKNFELEKGAEATDSEITKLFYDYVVENITYDYNKITTLSYDYVPSIDTILEGGSGICYDYSVLLAAMLRSKAIPAKLIKGYCSFTDVYHAWNEVYITDEKRWAIVDTTFDAYMYGRQRAYSFEKKREDYTTSYEY